MTGSAGRLQVQTAYLQTIPSSPTTEQRRIVAAIEQFTRLDAGVAVAVRASEAIPRLRRKAAVEESSPRRRTAHPVAEPAVAGANPRGAPRQVGGVGACALREGGQDAAEGWREVRACRPGYERPAGLPEGGRGACWVSASRCVWVRRQVARD
ncbi:MAG: hypothetical protein WKH64_10590 [Chloroflexia bacterium]